ncbi:15 kDa protein A-like [Erethizon dorsatum]
MPGAWKVLVLVLGLAGVSCVRRPRLRYEDIVTEALKVYNEGQQGRPLFRLLEATLPSRLNSTTRVPLNFRIRQTMCISTPETRQQPENCAFQEGGEERVCTGLFSKLRLRRSLTVSCDRDCGRPIQAPGVRGFEDPEPAEAVEAAEAAEAPETPEAEPSKVKATVPPAVRNMYEKAKYDIISNILSNF